MIDLKDSKTFDELLDNKYGAIGTEERSDFDLKSKTFMIGEMLKEARRQDKLSQEELAKKSGTKKSYISKLENGKIDIQLSTLFRIVEEGLGRKITLNFIRWISVINAQKNFTREQIRLSLFFLPSGWNVFPEGLQLCIVHNARCIMKKNKKNDTGGTVNPFVYG